MVKNQEQKTCYNLSMKRLGLLFTLVVFTFFVVLNIVFSQNISPLYFQIINRQLPATISFLKDIRSLPQFQAELTKFSKQYNKPLKKAVFAKENEIRWKTIYLKKLLKQNPNARDVLYKLSLLYQQEGNKYQANKYFNQAKQIDPLIGSND